MTRHEWKITTDSLAPDDKPIVQTASGKVVDHRFPVRQRPYRVRVDLTVFDDDQLEGRDRVVFVRLPTTVLFASAAARSAQAVTDSSAMWGGSSALPAPFASTATRIQLEPRLENGGLSQDRACAVRDALAAASGLAIGRFVARGFGETRPLAPNESGGSQRRTAASRS